MVFEGSIDTDDSEDQCDGMEDEMYDLLHLFSQWKGFITHDSFSLKKKN